jgi:hypothetical protein
MSWINRLKKMIGKLLLEGKIKMGLLLRKVLVDRAIIIIKGREIRLEEDERKKN